ncbi:fimbrial protein [Trinickia caryophylli]|uniref:Pilus assembly protein CpaE n=1 Tax=Trinickia caryophylli TaxID=28094 RepID=A0A1X7G9S3_TRICW|nr:fimbrial protein [Trinickia caryophylli]PMS11382.1 fimbrial protein [Trinickia caryophylli]TRX17577.1 fimbrial protein [Trinickia caryophylli]WQE11671.1 fimbrial protein [Trinickia caryophylli]SMF66304.1 pilus assembly protein CpaE [Trinickia caryophylli]GLU34857.1 fimbrial protein [Trinickia caryophylli]
MNARVEPLASRAAVDHYHFLFASTNEANACWLADSLVAAGTLEQAVPEPALLAQRIAAHPPALVFVDFSGPHARLAASAVQSLRIEAPQLPVVAVGTLAEPETALAALRAGVRDFVDMGAGTDEAMRVTRHVLEHMAEPDARHGRLTVLLGARVGVGVSTLAANLAVTMQRRGAGRHTALIDLGLPAGDGALYLNTRAEFDFVEAVRNLRRFDQTFVHTALSRHASGLALTTLPPALSTLRTVSHASAVALLSRLRAFFDHQIVDLGGFSNGEFVAEVARTADDVWLVCDPSLGAVVSATDLAAQLAAARIEREMLGLVVTKFDRDVGLSAQQIADKLELPLVATLPARRVPLARAANQGRLIVEAAPRDPYARALELLAQRLADRGGGGGGGGAAGEAAHGAKQGTRQAKKQGTKRGLHAFLRNLFSRRA